MSTLKTNNIEHLDASSASIQTTSGGGVIFAGISTFQSDANFDANVNIAGTITYEDVSSVDSVGVITARSGIDVGTGTSISSPSSNVLTLGTNNGERLRIDSSGRLLLACTTPPNSDVNAGLQIQHTSTANITLARNDSSITDGNALGRIDFYGNDGGTFEHCATIAAQADGAHADGDKPMRLIFGTSASSAATPTERLRITSAGQVRIGSFGAPSNKNSVTPLAHVDASGVNGGFQVNRHTSVGGGGAQLLLSATRGSSITDHTVLQDGDGIGTVDFLGSDGGEFVPAASIQAQVDGTPDDDDMPGRLTFKTTADGASGPTERVRIDSSGRVGINTTGFADTATALNIKNGASGSEHTFLDIECNTNETCRVRFSEDGSTYPGEIRYTHSNNTLSFRTSNSERIRIDTDGKFFLENMTGNAVGGSTVKYNNSDKELRYDTSSRLLKTNITECTYGIETIKKLKPSRYNPQEYDKEGNITVIDQFCIGFIADEMVEDVPEVVHMYPKSSLTKNVEDTELVPAAISYDKLTPVLTKALQEAITKIETLETKVAALEGN